MDRSSKKPCALCGRYDRNGGLYEISGKEFWICMNCFLKLDVYIVCPYCGCKQTGSVHFCTNCGEDLRGAV